MNVLPKVLKLLKDTAYLLVTVHVVGFLSALILILGAFSKGRQDGFLSGDI